MFDIGWSEIILIAVVALVVVGPKDLPKLMRGAAHWVRAARRMAGDFQRHVDDLMRESELDDLRREVQALRSGVPLPPDPPKASAAPASVMTALPSPAVPGPQAPKPSQPEAATAPVPDAAPAAGSQAKAPDMLS